MLCASHQPAALCEFFFITTSSLLRIYELIVSEDEGFVKKFAKKLSHDLAYLLFHYLTLFL